MQFFGTPAILQKNPAGHKEHSLACVDLAKLLFWHGMGSDVPPGQKWPTGQKN